MTTLDTVAAPQLPLASPNDAAADAVNSDLYPLTQPKAPAYQALVASCRARLAAAGACEMPDFVTKAALATLVAEATELAAGAFHNTVVGNAYLEPPPPSVAADDPRAMTETTALGVVAYDQFPETSLLRRLYEWEPLMRFIGAVLDLPAIYRYADPMGALNLSVMGDGDYLRWHFDQTDFVTSLSIQAATTGGAFEYVPMIRAPGRENFAAVRRVLQGESAGVVQLPNAPGSLVLFCGRFSLHRVTEIRGSRPRLMGLLAYDTKPGVVSSEHLRYIRYGRIS